MVFGKLKLTVSAPLDFFRGGKKRKNKKKKGKEPSAAAEPEKPSGPVAPDLKFKGFHVTDDPSARAALQKVMKSRPQGWTDHDYEYFIAACRALIKK